MSLLEILLSFVILLLVTLYLMSMFATGQSHYRRAQQFSTASFLANRMMQDLLALPVDPTGSGTGVMPEPWHDYTYTLDVVPADAPLYALDLEVRSPVGAIAQVRAVHSAELDSLSGIAVDGFTNHIAFVDQGHLHVITDPGKISLIDSPAGNGRLRGMLAGFPGANLLWQVNQPQGLVKFKEASTVWGAAIASPTAVAPPRYTGVALDRFGNLPVVGDANNRCLWMYQEDQAAPWTSLRATAPPLGSPAGIAMDPYATLIWVADNENQCLRKFVRTDTAPAYPVEADASGLGFWAKKQYRPPAPVTMGAPRGLAVDPQGWGVWVVDGHRLYQYQEVGDRWVTPVDLPPEVVAKVPSGLALDAQNSVVYVNCVLGQVAKFEVNKPAGSQWTRQFWP